MEKIIQLLKELREQRETKQNRIDELSAIALKANKPFTDDQLKEIDKLQGEILSVDKQIDAQEAILSNKQRLVDKSLKEPVVHGLGKGQKKDEQKAAANFSVIKALNGLMKGNLTGLEKEMHTEAEKQMSENGKSISGVGIPAFIIKAATSAETANEGAEFVPTVVSSDIIGPLAPKLWVEQLGVQTMFGLTGNLSIPKVTNRLSAAWEGQFDDAANTQVATDNLALSPKRMAGYTDIGKQWLLQSAPGAEAYVRGLLSNSHKELLDTTYWSGVASPVVIEGLIDLTNINVVTVTGANGEGFSTDIAIDMETAIANANADLGSMSYVLTPGVRGYSKKTIEDAGSNERVWARGSTTPINGYPAFVTNQLPQALTKGISSDLHAVFFGVWSQSIIAQWGAYDLTLDNITQSLKHTLRIVNNAFYDIKHMHEESFAVCKEIDANP